MEKTITLSRVLHQAGTWQDTTTRTNASQRNRVRSIAGMQQLICAPGNTAGTMASHKRCNQSALFLTNKIFRI